MLVHPKYNPVAFSLGPVQVHWYGLMYLVAFVLFLLLARSRARQPAWADTGWTSRDVEDLLFMGVLGVVLGARIGYVVFYEPAKYLARPLEILAVWHGGMSFHGGLVGVLLALWWFARTRGRRFLEVGDFVAPCVPAGLMAGRIGNFINGELWGRLADPNLPWAMVFPQAGAGPLPRHPSQLYQAGLEGLTLFLILWFYGRRAHPTGRVSGAFLLGYGVFRFTVEFFREPDRQLRDLPLMTMGQWLCVPMIVAGLWLILRAGRHPRVSGSQQPVRH